ncbi:hypothetical protein HHI36_013566, partial [Cryptolaemus montrouzieri]
SVLCDSSRGGIHRGCSGLNEDEIKITRTQVRNLKILCNKCTTNMNTFGLILEELTININTQISALKEEFNGKIYAMRTENDQIDELHIPENLENVVMEVSDRQNHAKNIIVFSLKERQVLLRHAKRAI